MMASFQQPPKNISQENLPLYHQLKQKVMLLVDDDPGARKMLKIMLREANFGIVEAENGRDALTKLSRHPEIDLALIDINMPQINGIQLINIIRKQGEYSRIPLIVVSAMTDQKSLVQSIKAGAQDFVVKPIDKKILIEKICKHLNLQDDLA
jgi:CheY-like chemotaxis protein